MSFVNYQQISEVFRQNDVYRAYFKPLSQNDNTKQQIYLGGSFESISLLPFGEIKTDRSSKTTNFKASLDFNWLVEAGAIANAPHSQLILYPDYPEVRLSGFIRGCSIAPSNLLQPVPRNKRTGNDGRFLVLGITRDGRIIAYLAGSGSKVALSIIKDNLLLNDNNGVL